MSEVSWGGRLSDEGALRRNQIRQESIAFFLDHRVALAHALFQFGSIQNCDAASAVTD